MKKWDKSLYYCKNANSISLCSGLQFNFVDICLKNGWEYNYNAERKRFFCVLTKYAADFVKNVWGIKLRKGNKDEN